MGRPLINKTDYRPPRRKLKRKCDCGDCPKCRARAASWRFYLRNQDAKTKTPATLRSIRIANDEVYQQDRDHLELSALMQAGVGTPRAKLSRRQIEAAIRNYDRSRPIWQSGAHEHEI